MGQVGDAYRGVRERMTALAEGADPDGRVPACPEWTVKELLAHVTGVIADILDGRLEGVASDPWTEAQVSARRGTPLPDILGEWAEKATAVEPMIDDFGAAGRQLVFDAVTHEHDLRGALDRPGAVDSDAVTVAAGFVVPGFLATVAASGAPVLEVTTPGGDRWVSGEGEPAARLHATPFDLIRAVSGRRASEQLQAMAWEGDAGPYLGSFAFAPFRPAQQPLAI